MPMNTDVKYFHSGMAGAPAELSYATPGTVIAMFDACLVDGFGLVTATSAVVADGLCTLTFPSGHSFEKYVVAEVAGATPSELNGQHRIISTTTNTATFETTLADQTATGTITAKVAAAGWEKAFSATNVGCYRSLNVASTRSFFRVSDAAANSYTYTVDGYESMTDAATGTGLFQAGRRFFGKNSSTIGTRKWFIVANASMVYVGYQYASSMAAYSVGCFGDIKSRKSGDAYRAFINGMSSANGVLYQTTESIFHCRSGESNIGAFARDYTGIGGKKDGYVCASPGAPTSYAPGYSPATPYPNGPDYGLMLSPLCVNETTRVARGDMPGLYVAHNDLSGRICTTNAVGTFLDDLPTMPGAVLAAIPISWGTSAGQWYACFIDIGRAWGN